MHNSFDLNQLTMLFTAVLIAVTAHEMAHGYAAYRMGDTTAKMLGRLTLNPIKHLDIFGSILLPAVLYISNAPFLFGYAKPVPVNFARFNHKRSSIIIVSSAGILTNLGIAILSGGVFQMLLHFQSTWYVTVLRPFLIDLLNLAYFSVMINTVLAIFNLLPIPPLDGSRILAEFLPASLKSSFVRLERFGMIIIFFLLITNSLSRLVSLFITPLLNFFLGR